MRSSASPLIVLTSALLLTILSPLLAAVAAAVVFGVSLLALIIRVAQRESIKRWSIVAAASLVLAFALAGDSDAIYGVGSTGGSDREGGTDQSGNGGFAGGTPSVAGGDQGTGTYAGVDPELEGMVNDWRSSGTEAPLFVPTYLPFPVAEVELDPSGTGLQEYYLWSDGAGEFIDYYLRIALLGPPTAPASLLAQGTATIDGRDYPYTEDASLIMGQEPSLGHYVVFLWEDGEEYMYQVEMNTAMQNPLPYEEFIEVVQSMIRIDPSDVG